MNLGAIDEDTSISFSDKESIKHVTKRLSTIAPGILKSLELESITMFPKVANRLKQANLKPNTIQYRGQIINT